MRTWGQTHTSSLLHYMNCKNLPSEGLVKLITTITPETILQVRKSTEWQSQMLDMPNADFQGSQITMITTRSKVNHLRLYAVLILRIAIYASSITSETVGIVQASS